MCSSDLVPGLKDRHAILAAIIASVAALAFFALPFKIGMLLASVAGIAVGIWSESK